MREGWDRGAVGDAIATESTAVPNAQVVVLVREYSTAPKQRSMEW